jgi:uncharacterized protein
MRRNFCVLGIVFFAIISGVPAQNRPEAPEFDVKEHYTKYEYRIPMRDGVHLFTSVYVPKDSSRAYPFLIDRTPYSVGPYSVDQYRTNLGPSPDFDKSGYIFVFQDVRGRYMSEGKFLEMRPHIDNKKSNEDFTTPSTGCSRTFPITTATRVSGAFRTPAFSPPPASSTRILL